MRTCPHMTVITARQWLLSVTESGALRLILETCRNNRGYLGFDEHFKTSMPLEWVIDEEASEQAKRLEQDRR
jgi:hypothetical protein